MLNDTVKLFGLTDLAVYLQPKLPNIKVEEVLFKYVTYNKIERLYLEGGGDNDKLKIIEIIQNDFDCKDELFILIDSGY